MALQRACTHATMVPRPTYAVYVHLILYTDTCREVVETNGGTGDDSTAFLSWPKSGTTSRYHGYTTIIF